MALGVKDLPVNGEDIRYVGSIPGLGRSPGGGNGNPLWYSYLGNTREREACGLQSVESQRVGHS